MRFIGPFVCIVTGGTSGIGEGCVRAFVKEGAQVAFCAKNPDEGKPLEAELGATATGRVLYAAADMTQTNQVENLVARTVEKFGRIDCLINNAGWHPPHKPIDDFSIDEFRALIDLNVIGVFAACKYALPHLRKTHGIIINISSLVAVIGQLHATTYVATKGAVTALTKALAIDEAAHGVRVNSISPGNIFTPLWRAGMNVTPDPQKTRAEGEAAQLMGRLGTPEEVASLCLFLAAEATFTTGVDHYLSGGAELAYGRKTRI
ncbi:MAG TPA: SDR family oxidoreductase [Planctomycetota bacterium]|nr:SDR family oxidoreductase [Planctomycetota bacterium]